MSSTSVVHTACTLDCPDACSLAVTVTDGRIVRIDAGPDNPLTDGWICAKVRRHAERVHSPSRVRTPLVRVGAKGSGEFREATWDEAIGLIAERMRASITHRGRDAVVAFTYNSSAAAVEADSLTEAFFAVLGATSVEHTICAHTLGASWERVYGEMNSADPLDVMNSRLIVVWGANPTASNPHFAPIVQRAVAAGTQLVVVDPRRTPVADRAHLHLALRPGTDVVLAYAVARHWAAHGGLDREFIDRHATGADDFLAASERWTLERAADVTGVPAPDIAAFADLWASTRPAMLRIGWGVERNANGGAGCRAVLALPVLGGHFGQPGAGVVGALRTKAVDGTRRWPREAIDGPSRRSVPMHQIGRWLAPDAGDPCEVLFVQGSNPAVMCPDQQAVLRALSRNDVFTVVHEQVLTDTTRYADVVLPATTSFEVDDVAVSYGTTTVQPVRAVVERVGEARSNDEVGLALARAMGFDWSAPPTLAAIDDPGPRRVPLATAQFVDTTPGAAHDGRARLADPDVPMWTRLGGSDRLTLISPATSRTISSLFGEFNRPSTAVIVHPDDAAARGLHAGDTVVVESRQGRITVPLEVNDATRPGVAVMAKGVWLADHVDGLGVNALTPSTGDDLVNGACFNDTFVEIKRAG